MKHNFKNKKIKIHPWAFDEGDVKAWEKQRFDLQHNGELLKFGASEVAQVVGKGYESAFKLFQIKLGRVSPKRPNLLLIHGNNVESSIMDYARSFDVNDPSEERTAENYLSKNFQRNIQKANYFIESEDYPAILVSLDGVLFKGEQDFEGNVVEYDTPVEFKNVSYSSFSRWDGQIPIYYMIQCFVQMAFTGSPEMWFIALVDNRELFIRKVEADEEWFEYINENTIDLSLRISKAKKIIEELDSTSDPKIREQLEQMIWELEPEVTSDEEDTKVLKEIYNSQDDSEVIYGDAEDEELCMSYIKHNDEEREAKSMKTLTKNTLLNRLKTASKMEVYSEEGIYTVKSGYRFTCTFKKHKEKKG